jgi:protein tyrosine/serine phosphatase
MAVSEKIAGTTARMRQLCRRAAMAAGAAVLAVVLGMGSWAAYLQATGNVHVVIPGRLYRSAELGERGFERVIGEFHIRTVINLRGANPGKTWYAHELDAARAMGVRHIDLAMSASHVPPAEKLARIRAVLATAPTPILIHCQGGADRSGLVAALYELWIAKRPAAEAGEQISFRYGHFPWLGSRTIAMDEAWRRVVQHGTGP